MPELTLTVQRWYYLFDRYNRWQIIADSIRYCQDNKGLELNALAYWRLPLPIWLNGWMQAMLIYFFGLVLFFLF